MNTKKCVVLDLDNTLWGGIVGEDGFDGITLSVTHPGSSFIAFQQALLDLYHRGIILAINSRNNFDDAIQVIRSHPNMILKEPHFAAMRINWNDKAQNIIELAKELNIGLDSMVFFDDDPTNRASVKELLPEVEVPELPMNPDEYAKFLLSLPYFPSEATTNEDKMRGSLYVTERLRSEAEKSFPNREEFLKSLGLELRIFEDEPTSIARLSQMTGKTNQFNVNKIPLSEEEIQEFIRHPEYKVFYGSVTDRFGTHGITNFAVVKKDGETWNIDHFLMSCRVIGRGIEEAFLSEIIQSAKKQGIDHLTLTFVPTEKNAPAEEFMKKHFIDNKADVNNEAPSPEWISIKYGNI
ncbi:HAD-IIIC family phosphatase [bacterium]|nr:MAG: HAD-IIIC family phosphatase [bacterium]